jgi:hypothetical protein
MFLQQFLHIYRFRVECYIHEMKKTDQDESVYNMGYLYVRVYKCRGQDSVMFVRASVADLVTPSSFIQKSAS